MKWLVVLTLAGFIWGDAVPRARAQQSACNIYKVTAPTLYVSKDAKISAEYIGVLERDNIACVTLEKKVGNRQWGYVSHKQVKGSAGEPINGWVGLRFMELQSKAASSTPASKPKPAATPAQAPAPVPQVIAKVTAPKAPVVAKPVIPAQPAAPQLSAAAQAEKAAENAYKATTAIGSCGAYKLFEEKYRNTFYGRLAGQFLQANCANKAPPVQAGNPGGSAPVGVASLAPPPVAGTVAAPTLSISELTIAIQQELKRLGCNPGTADGNWGRRSRNAMSEFNRYTRLNLDTGKASEAALPVLRSTAGTICPARANVTRKKPKKVVRKKSVSKPVKKKPSGSAKKKELWGGEQTRLDCERAITAKCF